MKESKPVAAGAGEEDGRVWVMKHFTGRVVLQFDSVDEYVADVVSVVHELPQSFYGTGHVVYGAAIYYHRAGTDLVARSINSFISTILSSLKPVAHREIKQNCRRSAVPFQPTVDSFVFSSVSGCFIVLFQFY